MSHEHIYEAGKSFWTYANSRECNGCFGCGYCILSSVGHIAPQGNLDTIKPLEIGDPPGKLDPRMKAIPVAVNNAYGDPTLQWEDTLNRIDNIQLLVDSGIPVVPYLRPIIPGFNDSEEFLDETIRDVSTAGARLICYAGLMGKEEVPSRLNGVLGEEVKPPKGFDRWEEDLKLVSPKCRSFIETTAKDAGLEVYRKTSC